MIPISYNVRSLLARKGTTLASLLGIALVVFVLSSSLMLSKGIERTMGASGSADKAIVLRKGSDAELASSFETRLVNLILAAPGVKRGKQGAPLGSAELVVVILGEKAGTAGQVANVLVRGVGDNVLELRPEVRIVEGRPAQPGTDEVIIGRSVRGRYTGVDLGKSFELKRNRPVKVVGVFEAGGSSFESEIWASADTVRSSFGRDGLVSSVTVALESPERFAAFEAVVASDKQLGLEAFQERAYYEKVSEGTSIFVRALGIVITVFFSIGAMIGASITMYAAVVQRKREIGTLRALGFSRGSVLRSIVLESLVLAAAGGALGALASLAMGLVKLSMMNFATWQEVTFSFAPEPGLLFTSLVVGAAMGLLGGFFPALSAARTNPVSAMRA
jgi:putative ABC transport system permease protein